MAIFLDVKNLDGERDFERTGGSADNDLALRYHPPTLPFDHHRDSSRVTLMARIELDLVDLVVVGVNLSALAALVRDPDVLLHWRLAGNSWT